MPPPGRPSSPHHYGALSAGSCRALATPPPAAAGARHHRVRVLQPRQPRPPVRGRTPERASRSAGHHAPPLPLQVRRGVLGGGAAHCRRSSGGTGFYRAAPRLHLSGMNAGRGDAAAPLRLPRTGAGIAAELQLPAAGQSVRGGQAGARQGGGVTIARGPVLHCLQADAAAACRACLAGRHGRPRLRRLMPQAPDTGAGSAPAASVQQYQVKGERTYVPSTADGNMRQPGAERLSYLSSPPAAAARGSRLHGGCR